MLIPCKQTAFCNIFTYREESSDRQNQLRSTLWNLSFSPFLFFSASYSRLQYIFGLGSIGDTTEFQFAFQSKIKWNDIFEVIYCRQIILIFFLLESFCNGYLVLSYNTPSLQQGLDGVEWWDQTMQGVKLTFFSDSHLAPKFFKVVAN